MKAKSEKLLAFYGDDFTGSTDALEFMSRTGARTVLFMRPPTPEQLSRYEPLDAIGVAGGSRTMSPDEMEQELRPAFKALQKLNTPHVHYKVCSTFDSSPSIGSIGKVIDIGTEIFESAFVPLLVAAPALGRYCTFGNLFARMGIGSNGAIYRLDRHPSMRSHPITPADESDLRLHLGRQTSKKIGLVGITEIVREETETRKALKERIWEGAEIVLFDALKEDQMKDIGCLIDPYGTQEAPLFSVGSSGIEMALGQHWIGQGKLEPRKSWNLPGKAEPLLVVSGSRSPVTSEQIGWALSHGFEEVALDTEAIAQNSTTDTIIQRHTKSVLKYIKQGVNVIIHTSFGEKDSRVEATRKVFVDQGLSDLEIRSHTAQLFGTTLGRIVRKVVDQTALQRIVFAGGDTSSYAARSLDIEALRMIAPISPGAPLCKISAPGSSMDGLEVNFKGGQVGNREYFEAVLKGKSVS